MSGIPGRRPSCIILANAQILHSKIYYHCCCEKKRFPQCAGKTLQSVVVLILEGVGKVVKKG
jgi:hypothetical protein